MGKIKNKALEKVRDEAYYAARMKKRMVQRPAFAKPLIINGKDVSKPSK